METPVDIIVSDPQPFDAEQLSPSLFAVLDRCVLPGLFPCMLNWFKLRLESKLGQHRSATVALMIQGMLLRKLATVGRGADGADDCRPQLAADIFPMSLCRDWRKEAARMVRFLRSIFDIS